jgi:MFS family permease
VAFLIPFSIFGVYTGSLTDSVSNRKNVLGAFSILWSLTTIVSGSTESFAVFATMRVLLGVLESANNPLAYSLIRDLFPPEYRSTANSIFTSSIYIGGAISSLSLLIIQNFGWRDDYIFTGAMGVIFGIATLLFLQEPERGNFDVQVPIEEPVITEEPLIVDE